jgi:hypothetical protein
MERPEAKSLDQIAFLCHVALPVTALPLAALSLRFAPQSLCSRSSTITPTLLPALYHSEQPVDLYKKGLPSPVGMTARIPAHFDDHLNPLRLHSHLL